MTESGLPMVGLSHRHSVSSASNSAMSSSKCLAQHYQNQRGGDGVGRRDVDNHFVDVTNLHITKIKYVIPGCSSKHPDSSP